MSRGTVSDPDPALASGEPVERRCPRTGLRLRGLAWRPTGVPSAGLLLIHGLQSNARWFAPTGAALAARGILCLAMDRRGSGRSEGYPGVPGAAEPASVGGSAGDSWGSGTRGHLEGGRDFLDDALEGWSALRELAGQGTPLHLAANCFGSRAAFALAGAKLPEVASLAFAAPSTDLRRQASFGLRAGFAAFAATPERPRWVPSPLRDEWFASEGPWLDWIRDDARSLSLRSVTGGFLRSAIELGREANRAAPEVSRLPLLLALARRDAIVDSARAKRRFQKSWAGELRVAEYDSAHLLDFGDEAEAYRATLATWIMAKSAGA
jgi:alpha-beta hydrolase superfamily lysophospholipase